MSADELEKLVEQARKGVSFSAFDPLVNALADALAASEKERRAFEEELREWAALAASAHEQEPGE